MKYNEAMTVEKLQAAGYNSKLFDSLNPSYLIITMQQLVVATWHDVWRRYGLDVVIMEHVVLLCIITQKRSI